MEITVSRNGETKKEKEKEKIMDKINVYLISGLFLLLALVSSVSAIDTTGQILYYTLDDVNVSGTTVYDISGNIDGTINNPTKVTTGQTGKINEAFEFTELDSGYISPDSSFTLDDFTISFWFKKGDTTAGNYQSFFRFDSSGAGYVRLLEYGTDNKWNFLFKDDGADQCSYDLTNISNFNDDNWHFVVLQKSSTTCANNFNIWVDDQKTTLTGSSASNVGSTSFASTRFIANDNSGTRAIDFLDEFSIFSRALNRTEISDLYNSGNGLQYPYVEEVTPPTPNATVSANVSFYSASFDINDITFSSENYVNAHIDTFNLSQNINLTIATAFDITKLTGGLTNDVYGRVLHNGIVIEEELLNTVENLNEPKSTGFNPLFIQGTTGTNNITYQFRRTGNGNIQIGNIDAYIIQLENTLGNLHRANFQKLTTSFSNTNFKNLINWTGGTNYTETLLAGKYTVTTDVTAQQDFRFCKTDGSVEYSDYVSRDTNANTYGTLFNIWADTQPDNLKNYSLIGRTSTGTTTVNVTVLDFDARDFFNNTVGLSESSNPETNLSNYLVFNQGNHKIANVSHTFKNGTGIFMGASVSVSGTDINNKLILNSTNSSITCFSEKDRYLTNNQSGNIYLFTICNGNLEINKGYEFNLYLENPTTNDIILFDETIGGFEITEFNLSQIVLTPELTMFTDLINNTINWNEDPINIYYNFTLGTDNLFDQANCALLVDGSLEETQTFRNETTNYLFTYTFGSVEADYTFEIQCSNDEINRSSGIYNYKVDTIQPIINSDFIDESNYFTNSLVEHSVNITDPNLIAYQIHWLDINGNLLVNSTNNNVSVPSIVVDTSYTPSSAGNITINVTAWDSHTSKELNYNITLINDYTMEYGNIMIYSDKKIKPTKYKDKYVFEIEKKANFCYKTNEQFTKIENHGYPNHYIDLKNEIWIDEYIFEFTEIIENEKIIELCFYNDKSENYITQSIGDLNVNSKVWTAIITDQNTFYLQSIDQTNKDIKEAINMIWYWGLFLLAVSLPFIVSNTNIKDNERTKELVANAGIVSVLIFVALLYITISTSYFTFTESFKNILIMINGSFLIMYVMSFIDF